MNRHSTFQAPLVLLAGWMLISVASYLLSEIELVFKFAYFVLPVSALVIPLLVALAATDKMRGGVPTPPEGNRGWQQFGLSMLAAIVGASSYLLCVVVVGRFLELPWRLGKFGEGSLSLGKTAAMLFCVLAGILLLAAWYLGRASSKRSRYNLYAQASIAMVLFAGALYLIIGATPLVVWRN